MLLVLMFEFALLVGVLVWALSAQSSLDWKNTTHRAGDFSKKFFYNLLNSLK